MGTSLCKLRKPSKSEYPFNKMAETEEIPGVSYFIEYFQSINNANQTQKQSLKARILTISKSSSSEALDYDRTISYYFCFPHAKSIDLIFIIDRETKQDQGFHLSVKIEEYLEAENLSEENKFIISKGCLGVSSSIKGSRMHTIVSAAFINLNKSEFSQVNYVHSDVFVSPAVYFNVHKACEIVYPTIGKEIDGKLLEFLIKVRKNLLLNPASATNPLLVQATTKLNDTEIKRWKSGYDGFPEEIKYFIDQTRLEKNVGLIYMTVINLIEGNTLGLPAKDYLPIPKIETKLYKHTF